MEGEEAKPKNSTRRTAVPPAPTFALEHNLESHAGNGGVWRVGTATRMTDPLHVGLDAEPRRDERAIGQLDR